MITWLALGASLDVTELVDRFELGAINRPTRTVAVAGGKSFNAARAAAALGADVAAVAVLAGFTGRRVEELLRGSGVAARIAWAPGETRTCISISAPGTPLTELYEAPSPIGLDAWRRAAGLLGDSGGDISGEPGGDSGGDWIALSGRVPEDVPTDELVAALAARRAAGTAIALDTSGPLLAVLVDELRPELVKVNRVEAAELLGAAAGAPLHDLARGIRSRTGGIAIVTDSVAGACAADAAGTTFAHADPVHGRFPVGSGDCFLGGLLAALTEGDALADALVLASAVASANAAQPGAGVFESEAVTSAVARIRARGV